MSRKADFEIKEITATDITGTYQAFGIPTVDPCVVAVFVNTSDVECYISSDGVNDIIRLPSGGTMSFDTKDIVDRSDNSVYLFGAQTQLQIKLQLLLAPATWGDVYCNLVTTEL